MGGEEAFDFDCRNVCTRDDAPPSALSIIRSITQRRIKETITSAINIGVESLVKRYIKEQASYTWSIINDKKILPVPADKTNVNRF